MNKSQVLTLLFSALIFCCITTSCSDALRELHDADIEDRTYPVYFMKNGGSGTYYSQDFVAGIPSKIQPCRYTPPAGKEFYCWSHTPKLISGTEHYKDQDLFCIKRSYTYLYAIWKDAESD